MPSFIAQQPNGFFCRFSTIVDTVRLKGMGYDGPFEYREEEI